MYAGNYAAHIKVAGTHEKVVELATNTTYVLSAYVKVTSGEINLGIKENTTSGTIIESIRLTNTDYEKATVTFTTGSERNLKFFLFAPQETDEGFGDNFEIAAVGGNPVLVKPAVFIEDFSFTNDPVLNPQGDQLTLSCLILTKRIWIEKCKFISIIRFTNKNFASNDILFLLYFLHKMKQ
ncbi:carbohydrate binding domain-containing protein [Aquimarina sp. RZ0]|uniref:carbohydrate binding domain-containing protein n=1 Tax=Aquimarina sp. RZ0 TaxID=2607730 RepID=UPI0011F0E946|nr:carbohydrate binding domain-containing protein [Aquimarina sp. RZ0]KAA1245585.1 hypothetical protein F0000_11590 [Aquimarina sp. RZ0]